MADNDPEYDKARAEYMASEHEYTPVRARRGNRIHATTWERANKTVCGKSCAGWVIALARLDCPACRLALHIDCRPKRKRYTKKHGRSKRRAR